MVYFLDNFVLCVDMYVENVMLFWVKCIDVMFFKIWYIKIEKILKSSKNCFYVKEMKLFFLIINNIILI